MRYLDRSLSLGAMIQTVGMPVIGVDANVAFKA